jgi:MIP family channel proteins
MADFSGSMFKSMNFQWGIDRSIMGFNPDEQRIPVVDTKAATAEFLGMFIFVVVGCGTAMSEGAFEAHERMLVAFAFGMSIMVLAYSIGHHSGGHINCAVTLSLVLGQQVHWAQGVLNFAAQCLGSIFGACLLCIMFPCDMDLTRSLGSNIIAPDYSSGRPIVAEAFGTFVLCFTVWETAVTPRASCGKNACIAIGFSVFLVHTVLLPLDGCSINPTRSLGPAIVSKLRGCENYQDGGLRDLWVMFLGPIIGSVIASVFQYPGWHKFTQSSPPSVASK